MAEYYAVLSKAVGGFDPSAAEARRAVYDKARNALIGQLKAIDPPLPTAEISRQRLELEEAIRRVEREASTAAPSNASVGRATPPPAPAPNPPPESPADEPAEDDGGSPQGIFRRAIQEAEARAGAAAPTMERAPARAEPVPLGDDAYRRDATAGYAQADTGYRRPEPERLPPRDRPAYLTESRYADQRRPSAPHLAPDYDYDDDHGRGQAEPAYTPDPYLDQRDRPAKAKRRRRGYLEREEPTLLDDGAGRPSRLPTIVLLVLIIGMAGALAVLAWSQRNVLSELLASFDSGSETSVPPAPTAPEAETSLKNTDRLLDGEPAERTITVLEGGTAGETGEVVAGLSGTETVAVASGEAAIRRAILYEEPLDPEAAAAGVTAIEATASWQFVPDGANGPEVIANLEVPQRGMTIRMSIRRNTDDALPASHLVEVITDTPGSFPGEGVASIPRLVVKPTEDARGQPLIGAAAKVADGFFWIALSAVAEDVAANLELLQTRVWFDLPMVYETGQRAILTFEKGAEGTDALNQALAAWNVG